MRRAMVVLLALVGLAVGSGAAAPQQAAACVVIAPANIIVPAAFNQASATVTYAAPSGSGADCGAITCTPASGSTFPIGVTTVSCSSGGDPGALATFQIRVIDVQPPTLTAPANLTVNTDLARPTAVVALPAPVIADNAPGVRASCTRNSGDLFPIGTTNVTCSAFDAAGNSATATFTVTVVDREGPTLFVPEQIATVATQPVAVRFAVGASDNSALKVTPTCDRESGSLFPVGVTTVNCAATDAAGNVTRRSFVVAVSLPPDVTKPFITRLSIAARVIRFTLSEGAVTTITIQRCAGACRKVVRRKVTTAAGARTARLVGVGGRRLGPGNYRVVMSSVDRAGNVSSTERISVTLR